MNFLIINADDFGYSRGIKSRDCPGAPAWRAHEHQLDGEHAGNGRDGWSGSPAICVDSAVESLHHESMPRISEFYGITIYMYYRDHAPPHFHAIYAEHEAKVAIETAEIAEGELPRRAKSLVCEWAAMHRDELLQDWELARAERPLHPIMPLD